MFAVVVTLTLKDGCLDAFRPLIHENAAASLGCEAECHRFDVCEDPSRPNEVFLYEHYTDAAGFQAHLATPHFKRFDAATADMLAAKDVRTFQSVYP